MIPRNHPQYVDIENFEEHEFTIAVAYEAAIRSPETIQIINRTLHMNTYWYSIDLLSKINMILDKFGITNIISPSEVKGLFDQGNVELKGMLSGLLFEDYYNIYYTTKVQEDHESREYEYLEITKKFYALMQKFLNDTKPIEQHSKTQTIDFKNGSQIDLNILENEKNFIDMFKYFESIDNFNEEDVSSEAKREIANFYKSLESSEQNVIKKMISLNVGLAQSPQEYKLLYSLSSEEADRLLNEYYLDTYCGNDTATLAHLHLKYNFIGIYDDRLDMYGIPKQYDFTKNIPEIDVQNEHFTIERSRPLLRSAKVADNIVLTSNRKELNAQIELLMKKVEMRNKFLSMINIYDLFVDNTEDTSKPPINDQEKIADIFFLYDNMKIYDKEKEVIQATYTQLIKNLNKYQKSRGVTGKAAIDDEDIDTDYTTTFDEKKAQWKDDMKNEIEILKRDNENNIKDELMKYHNEVLIVENNEFISYSEYQKRSDPDHPQSLFSVGEMSFQGMGRSSMYSKYKNIKNIIDERQYKKLL